MPANSGCNDPVAPTRSHEFNIHRFAPGGLHTVLSMCSTVPEMTFSSLEGRGKVVGPVLLTDVQSPFAINLTPSGR